MSMPVAVEGTKQSVLLPDGTYNIDAWFLQGEELLMSMPVNTYSR